MKGASLRGYKDAPSPEKKQKKKKKKKEKDTKLECESWRTK